MKGSLTCHFVIVLAWRTCTACQRSRKMQMAQFLLRPHRIQLGKLYVASGMLGSRTRARWCRADFRRAISCPNRNRNFGRTRQRLRSTCSHPKMPRAICPAASCTVRCRRSTTAKTERRMLIAQEKIAFRDASLSRCLPLWLLWCIETKDSFARYDLQKLSRCERRYSG